MNIATLVSKNLSNLQGYIATDNISGHEKLNSLANSISLENSEEFLGFYINSQDIKNGSIIVTNHRILFESEGELDEIAYTNIKQCNTRMDKTTNKLMIFQIDGSYKEIIVDGVKNHKFLDIYGFERFIKKVLVNIKLGAL